MKKFSVISLIIFLILCTAFIKNSTKKLDEKIFVKKENIRSLKNDYENIKLEHDYLSSTEKLFEFQRLYFDNELMKKDIQNGDWSAIDDLLHQLPEESLINYLPK